MRLLANHPMLAFPCVFVAGILVGMQMVVPPRGSLKPFREQAVGACVPSNQSVQAQTPAAEAGTVAEGAVAEAGTVAERAVAEAGTVAERAVPAREAFLVPLREGPVPEKYKNRFFSQYGQDDLVDQLLNHSTGGFFVESGAYNGVDLSNTLFFEASRGWKGLLIEANPYLYNEIAEKSMRTSNVIHACLSPTKEPSTLPFKLAGPIGGLVNFVEDVQLQRMASEIDRKEQWMAGEQGSGNEISVKCWPLHVILKALNVHRVDYWSLDIEGSEPYVLEATDFDAIDVRVLTVEVNTPRAEALVKEVMSRKKMYTFHSKHHLDLVYVKKTGMQ